MHLSCLLPFINEKKKHVILASNIVIVQIVISITSLPSVGIYWVLCDVDDGDTEKHHASSLMQDFVFYSKKIGCNRRYIIKP